MIICLARGQPSLPKRLISHHRHRIREVEASIARSHGQSQQPDFCEPVPLNCREARGFGSKKEPISGLKGAVEDRGGRLGCESKRPTLWWPGCIEKARPIHVRLGKAALVVIEPCPSHLCVIERKAHRPDQVQSGTRVGAQANDITGVWWDLRFDQHDVEGLA